MEVSTREKVQREKADKVWAEPWDILMSEG